MLILTLLLDVVSLALLEVYSFTKTLLRNPPTIYFEILFAVLAMSMVVLSYLYRSTISLIISSILFLLTLISIIMVRVVKK